LAIIVIWLVLVGLLNDEDVADSNAMVRVNASSTVGIIDSKALINIAGTRRSRDLSNAFGEDLNEVS